MDEEDVNSNPTISVPSKVFLIGEYAVMAGGRAWVAAIPPRFSGEWGRSVSGSVPFHPQSPAGRWFGADIRQERKNFGVFHDPWDGQGGFGGSTAEFAMAAWLSGIRDPLEAHGAYRGICEGERPLPSGADLLVQWTGGIIQWDARQHVITDLSILSSRLPLLVFSASHLPGRKTRTHEHLAALGLAEDENDSRIDALSSIIDLALSSLHSGDLKAMGSAFYLYGERLCEFGWESDEAHADRIALMDLPQVLGVKGCGAMQSDAMIVLMENLQDHEAVEETIRFAEARGLRLLSRGLPIEEGIRG